MPNPEACPLRPNFSFFRNQPNISAVPLLQTSPGGIVSGLCLTSNISNYDQTVRVR